MRYIFGFICFFIIGNEVLAKSCQQVIAKRCPPCKSWWEKGWAATLYSGPLTSQTSSKLFNDFDFGNSGIVAIAGSKKLGYVWNDMLDFELEGQLVQHF